MTAALFVGAVVDVAAMFWLERLGVSHAHAWMLAVHYACLVPAVALFVESGAGRSAIAPPRPALAALLVVYAVLIVALSAWWDHGILWGDEAAYRFTASAFARGRLAAPAPLPTGADAALSARELRFTHHLIRNGLWFTKYPPLWPAVLACGKRLGVPWLVNPVLGCATLAIVWHTAKRELESSAPTAVVLLATSPFFFMMSASQMSHVLSGLLVAGANLALIRGSKRGSLGALAVAIALVCITAWVRPFTALCAMVCVGSYAVWSLLHARRFADVVQLGALGFAFAGAALVGIGIWNRWITGSYLLSPYALYRGVATPIELSFAPATLIGSLRENGRWAIQDTALFAFPLVPAMALFALAKDKSHRGENAYLAMMPLAFWAAHLCNVEGSASRFGDRYQYEAFPALALLASRAIPLVGARAFALGRAIALLVPLQIVESAILVRPVLREIAPYVEVRDFLDHSGLDDAVVYLTIVDGFTGDRFNVNDADWPRRPFIVLVDPGEQRRDAVAASEGRARWVVVSWDAVDRVPRVIASSQNERKETRR